MSKKAAKKGRQVPSRQQQQQQAAARRQVSAATGGARSDPALVAEAKGSNAAVRPVRQYLDVSAVRIQEWLGRTPDLRFRRGASIMLSEATGRNAWPDARLPHGLQWNEEAGDLDSVVSLATDGAGDGDAELVSAAAQQVAAELRRALPHCPIQAVTGSGQSYAEAYRLMAQARQDGNLLVDLPPAPAELVLAKPCDQCRAASAEHRAVLVMADQSADLCDECRTRAEAAGGTKGDRPRRSPRPERRLIAALAAAGTSVAGFPDDFRQLAEGGGRNADDAATQLALIYADGNRVGAFLAAAAAERASPLKSEIVRAVDDVTLAALAAAVAECFAGSRRPPVLTHLAGGDDLMISVPAGNAWPFVRALLSEFGTRLATAASWPAAVRHWLPSLSAGLVFHHRSAPFPDVVRLAQRQLDEAKQCTRGAGPSVAFVDLTADGADPPPGRQPLSLAALHAQAARLDEIACVPRSHRERLVTLARLAAEDDAGSPGERAETPAEALARRVIDLGYQPLWDSVTGPGAPASAVRHALVSDPAIRQELRRVLDLARWWPQPSLLPAFATGASREVVAG